MNGDILFAKLRNRTFDLLLSCLLHRFSHLFVSLTWMDSLKGFLVFFSCWSTQTKTHLESSDFNHPYNQLVQIFCCLQATGRYLLEFEAFASSNQRMKMNTTERTQHHILKCPWFWLWSTRGGFDRRLWNDHQGCTKLPAQLLVCSWLSVKWTCINLAFRLRTAFITLRGLSLMFNF